MVKEAGTEALNYAGLTYDSIEQACVGYCYGDSTSGQRAVYELVEVIELHDCFSANELITYEALGLCDEGRAGELALT